MTQEICNNYLRILPTTDSSDSFNDLFNKPFRHIKQKEFPYSLHTAEYCDKTGLFKFLNWNCGCCQMHFKKTGSHATSSRHGYELTGEIDPMTHLINKNKHIVTIDMHNMTIRLRKVPKEFYNKYYKSYRELYSYTYIRALTELVEKDVKDNGGHKLETAKFRDGKDIKQLITDCPLIHEIKLELGKTVCYDCGNEVRYFEFAPNDMEMREYDKKDANCTYIKVT